MQGYGVFGKHIKTSILADLPITGMAKTVKGNIRAYACNR